MRDEINRRERRNTMSKMSDWIAGAAVVRLAQSATVRAARYVGGGFLRVDLDTAAKGWSPGCKVRVWVSGASFRTFTPFDWTNDSVSLLIRRHGTSPAAVWMDSLVADRPMWFLGPQRSLDLESIAGPVIVGDETSFALTAAWDRFGGTAAAGHVFEVTSRGESLRALEHLGIGSHVLVERDVDDRHYTELSRHVLDLVRRHGSAPVIITGKAQTIRAVRGQLKQAGVSPTVRVKAYWDPKRSGLD